LSAGHARRTVFPCALSQCMRAPRPAFHSYLLDQVLGRAKASPPATDDHHFRAGVGGG